MACDKLEKINELFLTSLKRELVPSDYSDIKSYTVDEVLYHPAWNKLDLSREHEYFSEIEEGTDGDDITFSPKFRIVFSTNQQGCN